MRLLIDTNVLMDVLVGREPFLRDSRHVVAICKERKAQGFLAAHTMTNLFYILRKYYAAEECRDILLDLLDIFSIMAIDGEKIKTALRNTRFKDFEDCLQMECGQEAAVDYIVTRNTKDFANSEIPCLTPNEACAMFPPEA
ncbi:MAG: PIN domain-containing protein [Schwartzia succinivorans]|nr:PIN domain-containing protein [Schwartzia succinivorans]